MTVQFYFDENVSGRIVRGLRRREVDILTAVEDGLADGLAGFADEYLLQRATDLDRVMFSQDSDLVAIAKRWQAEGRRFSGLIYVATDRIDVGRAVRELELIAKAMETAEFAGVIKYLPLQLGRGDPATHEKGDRQVEPQPIPFMSRLRRHLRRRPASCATYRAWA